MIYELNEPSKAAHIFAGWEDIDVSITACLENVMGKIYADDPEHPVSAMAVIGDFAFCAGEPDVALLRAKPDKWMIVVPQNEAWAALIEDNFPAYKRFRYALKKDTIFDRNRLERFAGSLPEGYAVFGSKEKYLELGRGFAVMKDGKIVSAASSYSRYREGIDIEISTVKEERHKGLGSAVAAKLILACLDEGLYPAWDAANKMSVRLAEKLGYEYSREYVCYGVE